MNPTASPPSADEAEADRHQAPPLKRWRFLGSLKMRLALIMLIAGIPLLMLSASLALQNYHLALGATTEKAMRLLNVASARHIAVINSTHLMLEGLSLSPNLTSGDENDCRDRLAHLLAAHADRYRDFAAFGPDGDLRCTALGATDDLRALAQFKPFKDLLLRAAQKHDFVLGPVEHIGSSAVLVIPAIHPVIEKNTLAGFLYAGIRLSWFAQAPDDTGAGLPCLWIVDRSGSISSIIGSGSGALPPAGVIAMLESGTRAAETSAVSGQPYAYASEKLDDSFTLLAGYPALADRRAAHDILLERVAQLGLLLALGLASIAFGVHVSLARPLTQLARAVRSWHGDDPFDAPALGDAPDEVAELAESFASATRAIAEQKAQLKKSEEQQALLMREIHHRVKNNLQIIASLLNLQSARIRVPEAKAEFASARDRVRALATLHRHLYAHGDLHTINMPMFLDELCGQLFQAMGETEGQRIRLDIDSCAITLPGDQAVPLSLIVTEAVSNALKYAFPAGRSGRVAVRLHSNSETATLIVEDDGVGLPPGRRETETGTRDGIGITLIQGFAKQLGGELTIEEQGGTRYTLRIKLHQAINGDEIAA